MMKILSNKIHTHAQKPQFLGDFGPRDYFFQLDLKWLKTDIYLAFNLVAAEEVLIKDIYYKTSLRTEALGVLDLFFSMLQGRAIESIDRINAKEFDFYCRDDAAKGSFEFYSQELYEILSIGEKIYAHIRPKKSEQKLIIAENVHFFKLSLSEQIDLIEEALAQEFYLSPTHANLEINILDIEDSYIYIEANPQFNPALLNEITMELSKYLLGDQKFTLILR